MPRQRKHMQSSNPSYAPTAATSPSPSASASTSFETSMGSDRHRPVSFSTRYTSYRVRYRCLPPLSICLIITFLCIAAVIVIPIVVTRNSNSSSNNDSIITSTTSNNTTTTTPTPTPTPTPTTTRTPTTTPTPTPTTTSTPTTPTPTPTSTSRPVPSATTIPIQVRPTVRNMYNHDSNAFTQGLELVDGIMYESTGLYGQSTIRIVNYETGAIVKQKSLDSMYFAEGLTVMNNRIYQITWKENIGFIYDLNLTQIGTFPISTQGWGLCHDDTHLILSDGSDKLYFINPTTFVVDRSVSVTRYDGSKRVSVIQINELEYIDGYVYANLWYTDTISVIEPTTGYVVKEINLDQLRQGAGVTNTMVSQNGAVCNGITYDRAGSRIFITGKLWPKLVEIDVILPATPATRRRRRRT